MANLVSLKLLLHSLLEMSRKYELSFYSATNATTGEGIEKGMEWLSGQLLQSA